MEITEEKIDAQNALLRVRLNPEDYAGKYDSALKQYSRQVQMPGFRAGKVPVGIVKKKYGKALLAEEINKLVSQHIDQYISDHNLSLLGHPIPSHQHRDSGNWEQPEDFEFVFELGLAPDLDVNISAKDTFEYYEISVSDAMIDERIGEMARRYGKMSDTETVGPEDLVTGDFIELDADKEIKPAGILHRSHVSMRSIDESAREALLGKGIGDEVDVDPHAMSRDHSDLAHLLGISHEEAHHVHALFRFAIKEIRHLEPAPLDQELFDKVYGEATVNGLDEFRAKVREELAASLATESERLFAAQIAKTLREKYRPSLPDEFLKRWIKLNNEKPISDEELEHSYEHYRKDLQWQLIFNKLKQNEAFKLSAEALEAKVKALLVDQYAQYGLPSPAEEELTENARRILAKRDEAKNVVDMLHQERLIRFIKEQATVDKKVVDFKAFQDLARAAQS